MKLRGCGKRGLPFDVYAPELTSQTALSKAWKVHLAIERIVSSEVLLVYVVLIESSNPIAESESVILLGVEQTSR